MYYFSLIPKISFTNPLKNFGTFLTTIVIFSTLLYLQDSQMSPTAMITTPIVNSQPDSGSSNTNKIPKPKPIRHTPNVFCSALNMFLISPPPFVILYSFYRFGVTNCHLVFFIILWFNKCN